MCAIVAQFLKTGVDDSILVDLVLDLICVDVRKLAVLEHGLAVDVSRKCNFNLRKWTVRRRAHPVQLISLLHERLPLWSAVSRKNVEIGRAAVVNCLVYGLLHGLARVRLRVRLIHLLFQRLLRWELILDQNLS